MTGSSDDEAAIQLDLYLERVLAGGVGLASDGYPVAKLSEPPTDEPDLAHIAAVVADGATRFHPSFRFEERLAARLRDAVVGLDRGVLAPGVVVPGVVVPFAPGTSPDRARSRHLGGVLVGGAIASGVSIASLAGAAAVVVWRRARWERLV